MTEDEFLDAIHQAHFDAMNGLFSDWRRLIDQCDNDWVRDAMRDEILEEFGTDVADDFDDWLVKHG